MNAALYSRRKSDRSSKVGQLVKDDRRPSGTKRNTSPTKSTLKKWYDQRIGRVRVYSRVSSDRSVVYFVYRMIYAVTFLNDV